jgi:hypothetical protein
VYAELVFIGDSYVISYLSTLGCVHKRRGRLVVQFTVMAFEILGQLLQCGLLHAEIVHLHFTIIC